MPPALQAATFRFTAVAAPRAGRPALQDKLYAVQGNSPLKMKALPFIDRRWPRSISEHLEQAPSDTMHSIYTYLASLWSTISQELAIYKGCNQQAEGLFRRAGRSEF